VGECAALMNARALSYESGRDKRRRQKKVCIIYHTLKKST